MDDDLSMGSHIPIRPLQRFNKEQDYSTLAAVGLFDGDDVTESDEEDLEDYLEEIDNFSDGLDEEDFNLEGIGGIRGGTGSFDMSYEEMNDFLGKKRDQVFLKALNNNMF